MPIHRKHINLIIRMTEICMDIAVVTLLRDRTLFEQNSIYEIPWLGWTLPSPPSPRFLRISSGHAARRARL